MNYYRLSKELTNNRLIPIDSDIFKEVTNYETDWYCSLYQYEEEHYKKFLETKSVAGAHDLKTPFLWWDFDCKEDLELSFKEARILVNALIAFGFPKNTIQIAFSGNKGVSVLIKCNTLFTKEEVKTFCKSMCHQSNTFDPVIYDYQRIFRIPFTKHQFSGLIKLPIHINSLMTTPIDIIQEQAKSIPKNITPDNYNSKYDICDDIELLNEIKSTSKSIEITKPLPFSKENSTLETLINQLDWSKKPQNIRSCKWALSQGLIPNGKSHDSLLILAATYKTMGYDKDDTYYLCKSALKKQAKLLNREEFPKDELWKNIIEQGVYGDFWNGGQYTCQQEGWLQDFCKNLGEHSCKPISNLTVQVDDVHNLFVEYVDNYEKNIIKTGIDDLDKRVRFLKGTSSAIIAAPGSGKTSLALNILKFNSFKSLQSIFFSYDMFHSAVYSRMVQQITGLDQEQIFRLQYSNPALYEKVKNQLKEDYKNVEFCFKSGQNIKEIEQTIDDVEQRTGKKVDLVVVDYNELVTTDISDPTASSAFVAQKLRQIANEKMVCVLTLLQPSKIYSKPSDEITSYTNAKGSNAIPQSMTVMLGCSRPGFHPRYPEEDRFMTISCVKNRNGPLFTIDLNWDGRKGIVTSMNEDDRDFLRQVREKRQQEKASEIANNSW